MDEVTTITSTLSETVTCTNPAYTPTGPGDECNIVLYNIGVNLGTTPPTLSFSYDAQFEYQYLHEGGATFCDFCDVFGRSGSITLPSGVTVCCGTTVPSVTYSALCNPGSITTTATSVSGPVTVSFTVTNLCSKTIICVDDTTCP
ncbi:MAG: hypothetical protein H0Z39_01225 [Peptococcaceae bacterium]|nr:hypothetical protein [Peptococcaceae bacterium]